VSEPLIGSGEIELRHRPGKSRNPALVGLSMAPV
jgi:hypothetical protein